MSKSPVPVRDAARWELNDWRRVRRKPKDVGSKLGQVRREERGLDILAEGVVAASVRIKW